MKIEFEFLATPIATRRGCRSLIQAKLCLIWTWIALRITIWRFVRSIRPIRQGTLRL